MLLLVDLLEIISIGDKTADLLQLFHLLKYYILGIGDYIGYLMEMF